MVHYTLLKLTKDADVTEIYFHCRKVYAELEMELPFLHDANVYRCEIERNSNADIMIVMRLDGPEYLNDYLCHPKHQALVSAIQDYVMDSISFDEKAAC